eukprot:7162820-Pyramimonas_sp.AAC.1
MLHRVIWRSEKLFSWRVVVERARDRGACDRPRSYLASRLRQVPPSKCQLETADESSSLSANVKRLAGKR